MRVKGIIFAVSTYTPSTRKNDNCSVFSFIEEKIEIKKIYTTIIMDTFIITLEQLLPPLQIETSACLRLPASYWYICALP